MEQNVNNKGNTSTTQVIRFVNTNLAYMAPISDYKTL